MNVRLSLLPLFLTGALLVGCDRTAPKSTDAGTDAKAADAKAAVDKAAADAKATANKNAADASSSAILASDKAAADAKATAKKEAADASAVAERAAANANAVDTKAAADAATAKTVQGKAAAWLTDLQTAVNGQKWTDAAVLIKQLDDVRDRLPADQKASFDSLKKQYNSNKQ